MARTDTLNHFLTDVADAIRTKKGTSGTIEASEFDTEISSIVAGETEPLTLMFGFNNTDSAMAEGNIVLTVNDSSYNGTYSICWANSDGVMTNYAPIGELTVSTTKLGYIKMIDYKAIPKYATKIVAVDSNDDVVATFIIPSTKIWDSEVFGEHTGSIMIFSDEHVGYNTASDDFEDAITYGNQRESILAMVGAGDLTSDGSKSKLDDWKTIRDTYRGTTPVYTCNGNHESYTSGSYMVTSPTAMRDYLDTDYTNETENYFAKTIGGITCLFVPIFEGAQASVNNTMFSSTVLTWLENQLESHRNERVLIFAHVFPNQLYTPYGFANAWGAYSFDIWGSKFTNSGRPLSDRTAFLTLLSHYKNAIWVSGHSHIKYEYDKDFECLNVCRYNDGKQTSGSGATFIHASSITVPRDIINGTASDYIYAESEVAIIDIYPNHLRMRCRNVADGVFYGFNEYIIDTTPVTIPGKVKELSSISASIPNSTYYEGDSIPTVTVTATYSDSSTSDVSSSATIDTSNVTMSTAGTYTINVSYTENEVTKTTTVSITVVAIPETVELSSISATKTTTTYTVGDTVDYTDVVVTATYSDSTTATVTSSATIGTVDTSTSGSKTLSISYTEDSITKTTSITITVNEQSSGEPTSVALTAHTKKKRNYVVGETISTSDNNSYFYCDSSENVESGKTYTLTFNPPSNATYTDSNAYLVFANSSDVITQVGSKTDSNNPTSTLVATSSDAKLYIRGYDTHNKQSEYYEVTKQ